MRQIVLGVTASAMLVLAALPLCAGQGGTGDLDGVSIKVQESASEVQATLIDRVENLFDDHVLTLLGLLLAGAIMAIATTAVIKRIWPPLDEASREISDKRYRLYTLSGMAFGGGWTLVVTMAYLSQSLGLASMISLTVALGLAVVGAAATPKVYDVLDWTWALALKIMPAIAEAALGWVRRKGGGPPSPPPPPES